MNDSHLISQTTLNAFYERICLKITYLATKLDSATPLWDGPIAMCEQIKRNPLDVDSIVMKAKERNSSFNGTLFRFYHAILCRVYMILYYLHRDDKMYQEIVFPELKKNMGPYTGTDNLKTINEQIDKILAQEAMYAKFLQEKKREQQNPKFTLPKLSRAKLDNLFDEYSGEDLFYRFSLYFEEELQPEREVLDLAELWYAAKDIVRKLAQVDNPDMYIDRILHQFDTELGYVAMAKPQCIMVCVYVMMLTVEGNHFVNAIKKLERYSKISTNYQLLGEYIPQVRQWFKVLSPVGNYDYVGEQQKAQDTFTRADVERIQQQCSSKLEEQTMKASEMEKQLSEKDVEIKRLKYEYAELEKSSKETAQDWEKLDEAEKLGIDERIVFFSSALRINLAESNSNQSGLARFICQQTGDSINSVRPRINKIAAMQKTKRFDEGVTEAAENVVEAIRKCWKKGKDETEYPLSDGAKDMIEDITLVYPIDN